MEYREPDLDEFLQARLEELNLQPFEDAPDVDYDLNELLLAWFGKELARNR